MKLCRGALRSSLESWPKSVPAKLKWVTLLHFKASTSASQVRRTIKRDQTTPSRHSIPGLLCWPKGVHDSMSNGARCAFEIDPFSVYMCQGLRYLKMIPQHVLEILLRVPSNPSTSPELFPYAIQTQHRPIIQNHSEPSGLPALKPSFFCKRSSVKWVTLLSFKASAITWQEGSG